MRLLSPRFLALPIAILLIASIVSYLQFRFDESVIKESIGDSPDYALYAVDCFSQARTQLDINACAFLEYKLALEELEIVIEEIGFRPEHKENFDKLQEEWLELTVRDCEFLFGRIETHPDGGLTHTNGSMSAYLRGMCMADRTKERIWLLNSIYVFP